MYKSERVRRAVGSFDAFVGRIQRRSQASPLSLLGAALGICLCLLLLGCGAGSSAIRGPLMTPNGPAATATAAAATATEGALPLIPLPYMQSAPGCGASAADWIVQSAEGIACLSNPQRMHLTGRDIRPHSAARTIWNCPSGQPHVSQAPSASPWTSRGCWVSCTRVMTI